MVTITFCWCSQLCTYYRMWLLLKGSVIIFLQNLLFIHPCWFYLPCGARIKCPVYCTKETQFKWPPLLFIFLVLTLADGWFSSITPCIRFLALRGQNCWSLIMSNLHLIKLFCNSWLKNSISHTVYRYIHNISTYQISHSLTYITHHGTPN